MLLAVDWKGWLPFMLSLFSTNINTQYIYIESKSDDVGCEGQPSYCYFSCVVAGKIWKTSSRSVQVKKGEKENWKKNHPCQRLLANSVYSTLNIFPLPPPKITRKKKM